MKNNFYNISEDWYKEFNNNFNISNNMDSTNTPILGDPKESFLRGNLFNDLYQPYKNYKYTSLKPTNKKEELLYNLLMYKFVLNELDLYLDTHPNNSQVINLYNNYLKEEKQLCKQYESNYGPLTIDSENLDTNYWNWIKSPWPWEVNK